MSAITFADAYCLKHQIPADRFSHAVFTRVLYPHARLLAGLMLSLRPDYFAADLDLVRGAGRLRRRRDFSQEVTEYLYNPANVGFLRRWLRIRVSTHRLRLLVNETLGSQGAANSSVPGETAVPFGDAVSAQIENLAGPFVHSDQGLNQPSG